MAAAKAEVDAKETELAETRAEHDALLTKVAYLENELTSVKEFLASAQGVNVGNVAELPSNSGGDGRVHAATGGNRDEVEDQVQVRWLDLVVVMVQDMPSSIVVFLYHVWFFPGAQQCYTTL